MTEPQFLSFLKGPTTDRVLDQALITIAGSPQPSGVLPYYMKADLPRNGKEFFRTSCNPVTVGAGSHTFNAHSIQMVPHANVPALNQVAGYVLDNNGPDLMVTGMLNGCSFIMKANAGRTAVRCAHLQPPPGKGVELNVNCVNTAAFLTDAGPVRVFGRLKYQDSPGHPRSCTVLGVRRGSGAWEIYAQIFDGNFKIVAVDKLL
jgi:hypothetical protein